MSSPTGHFIAQRVTAVVLAVLGIWFACSLISFDSFELNAVRSYVAQPLNGGLLALLSMAMAYHSYLGVEVVIDDYVHAPRPNWMALLLSRVAHLVLALVSLHAIYQLGFGA
ncbi:MAG: succinate dehydrogenase, hydrophobic membrane anchor protein [Proteobacteria bacterium]|nr:succinate dehydrogenase, hydrophobic membrane anchor protein [Pseudomonadota bacterium]MDA1063253.1 succinate dehydrogenase, hydrophobic membrane anchor protein [Pseudomonadota bacterium]